MSFVRRSRIFLPILALTFLIMPAGSLARSPQPAYARLRSQVSQDPLAIAEKAERDGDVAAAEAGYRAIAGSGSPSAAAQGNLALGRLLEVQGRSADAIAPLQAAKKLLGAGPDGLRATFLLGEAEADQQQTQAAVASFHAYVTGGGAAAGYAALKQAWTLQAAGDDQGALSDLSAPLQATSLTVRRAALQAASQSLENLGNDTQAAADEQALADTHPSAGDRASALAAVGRLDQLAGDSGDAIMALQHVIQNYPSAAAAPSALKRLDALGASVDPLQRAVVLVDQHDSADAEPVLQQIVASQPAQPLLTKATYYLALLDDRANDNEAALSGYANAYQLDPTGSLAPAALWNRAQLLRSLNRYAEAEHDYAALAQQFPQDANAADAGFDAGLMAAFDNRSSDAEAIWKPLAQSTTGANAARLDLWLGKLALAAGDAATAATDFKQSQQSDPSGYFGLRAEAIAGNANPPLIGGALAAPPDTWSTVADWISGWAGAEDSTQFNNLQATQDWREGIELSLLGWKITPLTLLSNALAGAATQPWALYEATRVLQRRGLTEMALQAAEELIALAPGDLLSVPPTLLRAAYPLDYLDLVNQDAAQNNIDPVLIYAVLRQESAFNPAAGSSAGAQGLLQLEPGTAQDAANALGIGSLNKGDLARPLINLQLGAYYLAQQAQAAGNNLGRTLAAYNAGGGNANRWAKQAGADPDRFYQDVDFGETRAYIRDVSENDAIYRYLYRGATHPTLLGPP